MKHSGFQPASAMNYYTTQGTKTRVISPKTKCINNKAICSPLQELLEGKKRVWPNSLIKYCHLGLAHTPHQQETIYEYNVDIYAVGSILLKWVGYNILCIGSIYYRQHNKQLVIMVLQRHVSTHTSHYQVTFRTFWF
jgi:hypothetical protein